MEEFLTDANEHGNNSIGSPPCLPADSPGSSVSTRLQEEYTELLKYTVNSVSLNEGGSQEAEDMHTAVSHILANTNVNKNNGQKSHSASNPSSGPCTPRSRTVTGTAPEARPATLDSSTDPAVQSMSTKLDSWLADLKRNVLGELSSALLASIEAQQQEQRKEFNELTAERMRLEKEINKLNETINGMEQSICHKDTLIDNLTQSLAAQKGKTEMALKFYNWKASHLDIKREKFTDKLAVQHHNMKISYKVFKAWFGLIQTRWRSRMERACQEQAQGVCLQLTNDYEAKVSSLNETVQCLENKLSNLHAEREAYADGVKKAFMRGVCALNMEAMSAFNPETQPSESSFFGTSSVGVDTSHSLDLTTNNANLNFNQGQPFKDVQPSKSLPPDLTAASSTDLLTSGRVTKDSGQPTSLPAHHGKTKTKSAVGTKTKPSSSYGPWPKSHSQVLAPPMASVVVEKHQPITKLTIGKSVAMRYPKHGGKEAVTLKPGKGGDQYKRTVTSSSTIGQHFKPLAGQTRADDMLKTQVVSIKVVD